MRENVLGKKERECEGAWYVWGAAVGAQTVCGGGSAQAFVGKGPPGVQEGGSEKAFCGSGKSIGRENLEAEVMGLFLFSF